MAAAKWRKRKWHGSSGEKKSEKKKRNHGMKESWRNQNGEAAANIKKHNRNKRNKIINLNKIKRQCSMAQTTSKQSGET